jgi:hypothetical protein
MSPTGSPRDLLWAAAEREAHSMNPQAVVSTVWALATLDMPPADSLCDAIWAADGREAPN